MKEWALGSWQLLTAGVLAVVGMFYRHGNKLAGLEQWREDAMEDRRKMWDKLNGIDAKVTDIQIKVGRGKRGRR